jgi:hypothetical protein
VLAGGERAVAQVDAVVAGARTSIGRVDEVVAGAQSSIDASMRWCRAPS